MKLETNCVGVDTTIMHENCEGLKQDAQKFQQFIDDLGALEQDLSNYWEGEDLNMLHAEFATFKSSMMEMPEVITSIASWGESASDAYESVTSKTITGINEIFRA